MKVWDSPYRIEKTNRLIKVGAWEYTDVKIFLQNEEIGAYTLNYPSMPANLFHPFLARGKHYALYAKHYTCSSIMELPSCREVWTEQPDTYGFCPRGFAVPEPDVESGFDSQFGFMCGCVWGDDGSWKIRFLDLSKLETGVVTIDARFGYLELLADAESLKDAIELDYWAPLGDEHPEPRVRIAAAQTFEVFPEGFPR